MSDLAPFAREAVMKIVSALLLFGVVSCRDEKFKVPEFSDEIEVGVAAMKSVSRQSLGYGVATSAGSFSVSISGTDSSSLRVGQRAIVFTREDSKGIPATVTNLFRSANLDTGQSIVTLASAGHFSGRPGDFVRASIFVQTKPSALVVPKTAVFVKDGATWAIREGKAEAKVAAKGTENAADDNKEAADDKEKEEQEASKPALSYIPVKIETGFQGPDLIEVTNGLKAGDRVVSKGGLGFLMPDFKASAEGD